MIDKIEKMTEEAFYEIIGKIAGKNDYYTPAGLFYAVDCDGDIKECNSREPDYAVCLKEDIDARIALETFHPDPLSWVQLGEYALDEEEDTENLTDERLADAVRDCYDLYPEYCDAVDRLQKRMDDGWAAQEAMWAEEEARDEAAELAEKLKAL